MEQEYILRVVQRAGEKTVKCLKSRGRQRLWFCCCDGQSSEGQGSVLSAESCSAVPGTGLSETQEFHTAVRPRECGSTQRT